MRTIGPSGNILALGKRTATLNAQLSLSSNAAAVTRRSRGAYLSTGADNYTPGHSQSRMKDIEEQEPSNISSTNYYLGEATGDVVKGKVGTEVSTKNHRHSVSKNMKHT